LPRALARGKKRIFSLRALAEALRKYIFLPISAKAAKLLHLSPPAKAGGN
jgi:hypothetical protein